MYQCGFVAARRVHEPDVVRQIAVVDEGGRLEVVQVVQSPYTVLPLLSLSNARTWTQ